MKIVSFAVKVDSSVMNTREPMKVEYPELDRLLLEGYAVIDMIPVWGTADTYFLTFMLEMQKRRR